MSNEITVTSREQLPVEAVIFDVDEAKKAFD